MNKMIYYLIKNNNKINMLKITNYELECNDNILIAHFSDIHYSKHFNNKVLEQIVQEMKRTKPNYICITGDIVDNLDVAQLKEMKSVLRFLDELSKISKVMISLGNHDTRDYRGMKDNKWYNNLNKDLIVLNNSCYEDDNLYFYGLTIDNDYYLDEEKKTEILFKTLSNVEVSKNKYNILMFHSPINFDKDLIISINKFDLILSGHTHNGLTPHFFPGNFGFVGPHHNLYLKNARNSFKSGNSNVIISGGITKLPSGTNLLHIFNKFYASDLNYIYLKKGHKN